MPELKSWLRDNSALIYFLIAQAIFFGGMAFSGWGYMVRLESRVATLEIRGSPHLNIIDNRLTVLEKQTEAQQVGIDRIVNVMTKELHIQPTREK
jgi:hypothetical protein